MCKILGKYTDSKVVTGYKIAIKHTDGKYYSPFTGMEYKIGKVIPMERINYSTTIYGISNILSPYNQWFNSNMHGMTGVILPENGENDIMRELRKFRDFRLEDPQLEFALLEMTITGNLHKAIYTGIIMTFDTIIGNTILSFTDVTDKKL